jgi:hypothetical protein
MINSNTISKPQYYTCTWLETDKWSSSYQRNNKRTGLKNLRCFPYCSNTGHKEKGFCGMPLQLQVTRNDCTPLYAYGEFRRSSIGENTIQINDILTSQDLQDKCLDSNRVSPFHKATLVDGLSCTSSQPVFIFNEGKRGWNYSWAASKHIVNAQHQFVAYIFIQKSTDTFQCVATSLSPSFSLCCRKRRQQPTVTSPPTSIPEQVILTKSTSNKRQRISLPKKQWQPNNNTIVNDNETTTTMTTSSTTTTATTTTTSDSCELDDDGDSEYEMDTVTNNNLGIVTPSPINQQLSMMMMMMSSSRSPAHISPVHFSSSLSPLMMPSMAMLPMSATTMMNKPSNPLLLLSLAASNDELLFSRNNFSR